jgi:transposase
MSSKRIYRRVKVKQVSLDALMESAISKGSSGTTVGLDVAKNEIVAVVRWPDDSFERPWSINNPTEICLLVEMLCLLRETCDGLVIGLESTGTYSEAIRYAMTKASLEVHRVSGKGVSDYKELFDGVPSQHDGKDAAMIAELTHFGKGTAWPWIPSSQTDQVIKHQVTRLSAFSNQSNQWIGRLEAILAKHWPELTGLLKLSRVTLQKVCQHYGSPAALVCDDNARQQLRRWGGALLTFTKIDAILESARTTAGLPMDASEIAWLQEIASEVLLASAQIKLCEKKLRGLANAHDQMKPYVKSIGAVTLCTIWATVGDPSKYTSSGAFLKALGLNLKELSSGKRKGELAITKRGPSLARKILFFWALRSVKHPAIKRWYVGFQKVGRGKSGTSEHRKMKGLISLLRKLCRSLWYCQAHSLPFDYAKVFPGTPLDKRKTPRNRRKPALTIA